MVWVRVAPVSHELSIAALKKYARSGLYGSIVRKHLSWLLDRCGRYEAHFQAPEILLAPSYITVEDRQVLGKLYKYAEFDYADEQRALSKYNICPYCGLQKSVTIDHYLPQNTQDFPHLSFFSLNLIPACTTCQGKKKAFWSASGVWTVSGNTKRRYRLVRAKRRKAYVRESRNDRLSRSKRVRITNTSRILHPYLDHEIDLSRLSVTFSFDPRHGPTNFGISYSRAARSKESKLIKSHLEKLAVIENMHSSLRLEWDSLGAYLFNLLNPGASFDEVKNAIRALAHKDVAKHGPMSLEHKFLSALATNSEAIECLRETYLLPVVRKLSNKLKASARKK